MTDQNSPKTIKGETKSIQDGMDQPNLTKDSPKTPETWLDTSNSALVKPGGKKRKFTHFKKRWGD